MSECTNVVNSKVIQKSDGPRNMGTAGTRAFSKLPFGGDLPRHEDGARAVVAQREWADNSEWRGSTTGSEIAANFAGVADHSCTCPHPEQTLWGLLPARGRLVCPVSDQPE